MAATPPQRSALGAPRAHRLAPGRRMALLARLLLLQAAWSYERMQSVGLAAALAGEGRRLTRGNPAEAREFLERHLGYFNTNPVAASGLVGALVQLEEQGAAGGRAATIARFKQVLAGPAAAWGDTLYWGTLRPATTALAVVGLLLFGIWGPVIYLVGYNAVHFYWRVRLLDEGYARGVDFGSWLSRSGFRRWPEWLRPTGVVLLGVAIGLSLTAGGRNIGGPMLAVVTGSGAVAAHFLGKPGRSGAAWGFAAVVAGLIHAALFG